MLVLAALALLATGWEPEWREAGANEDGDIYFSYDGRTVAHDRRQGRVRFDLRLENGASWSVARAEIDCAGNRSRIRSGKFFSHQGDLIHRDFHRTPWIPIPPASTYDRLKRELCPTL